MLILGIETSCDETAAAVVRDGVILSNVVSSQADLHAAYGGVVPEVASRQHLRLIDEVLRQACLEAKTTAEELDAIAVTRGPGLPSALLVGVAAARGLASRLNKPLFPIHHLEAHLYSALPKGADDKKNLQPFISLIISGGHTLLVHAVQDGQLTILGRTLDDAVGECFDKVAQLVGLPYPGGPEIEREAKKGNPRAFDFPRPMLDSGDWNFSFSGLKTAVKYEVRSQESGLSMREGDGKAKKSGERLTHGTITDLCASFQAAVIEVLVEKTIRAARAYQTGQISLSGGVACNMALREAFERRCRAEKMEFTFAERRLCGDNAAMIALLAEKKMERDHQPPGEWDIDPDWILAYSL